MANSSINETEIIDLLTNISANERFKSTLDLVAFYVNIIQHGAGLPYTKIGSVNIDLSLESGKETTFNFTFPDEYVGIIPFVEFESDISKVRVTCKVNLVELMRYREVLKVKIPDYLLDRTTQIHEYDIPSIRNKRYIPFMPIWNLSINVRNDNTSYDANNIYISFPYVLYTEEKLVNFYFNTIDKLFNVIKDLSAHYTPIVRIAQTGEVTGASSYDVHILGI